MLIVQKFGGTSVGDLDRIRNVANRVKRFVDEGHQIVVVVSAMSGETNKLIGFANTFSDNPSPREMDLLVSSGEQVTSSLLAILFKEMGCDAVALTGRQAGIQTDNSHMKARIESIDKECILSHTRKGRIVVVAGFQGVSEESGEITTLGRGGSDLTAVAIAGAIGADLCEIYTDVDGIYTTDPRIEPKARKIESISYDEMLEMASLGAKVLQNRSVEMAKKMGVRLVTRSSFSENEGTLIVNEEEIMEKPIVSGIALDRNQARVTLRGVDDRPGIAAEIFNKLSESNVNVDMIVQNVGHDGKANLGFTVPETELIQAKDAISHFHGEMRDVEYDDSISKVSIVGVGMKSHSGVASNAFNALSSDNINILMISTSEIKISIIIDEKYSELAVRSLHTAYELDK